MNLWNYMICPSSWCTIIWHRKSENLNDKLTIQTVLESNELKSDKFWALVMGYKNMYMLGSFSSYLKGTSVVE